MKWTTDAPTEDGWYWLSRKRGDLRPRIARVYRHFKGYIAISEWPLDQRDVTTLDYIWAGPLPEPEGHAELLKSIHKRKVSS